MNTRHYTLFDRLCMEADAALRTLYGRPPSTERPLPDADVMEPELTETERRLSGRLMRVNHSGEVSAQGLYQGQALTARREDVRQRMERSAAEENDHLVWCEHRMQEVGAGKSLLNPLWYAGSFTIGAVAGAIGDKWSLGFVNETEQQVIRHLDEHLERLPAQDDKSRAILEQMREDEAHHGAVAMELGGAELPLPVRKLLMPLMSKVMTRTAFWI
ncbi:MAG: 2-polyprenyl-3-methyl-6-methoxy-1,4-benzoquinone monooxygenase [Chromatiales bacterium]|jgi:ubiquinone biosynthesis monooxygenase Coq7|nr:2-polyprenyl-3-methyl-6-methoxy-1,4-benzoquinone monooxygenase [Chromatiales bacterium]MDX9768528.1 2-polyprenyl-3-methyl-6-methoxy-1,4-benzoquinone monooxygenase [Ectothiorhodospiraceae bacterium]